jgi:hypothetical protein
MLGYLACSAGEMSSRSPWIEVGLLLLLLSVPILLQWHHLLLILVWNLPVTIFFLPGSPGIWLPMLSVSLGISLLQRAMSPEQRFIPAPQITWPLLCMTFVVLFTAKFTGGIGLRALGDPVMGGKKYVFLLAGILGFFALSARRIPLHLANRYVALFFLSGCIALLGDIIIFLPSKFYYLYLFFPPDMYTLTGSTSTMRFGGASGLALAVLPFMLARYGLDGIFQVYKPWRPAVFLAVCLLGLFGGFRGLLLNIVMLLAVQFCLEGKYRTKMLPIVASLGVLGLAICLPMSDRMPSAVQRAISFLPVKIDPAVKADADASLTWHVDLWKGLLPQVPSHLLLGKGYAISQTDFLAMGVTAIRSIDPGEQALALSSDYHNGPLSVILPFGIWGAIAFLWFSFAGIWALHRNYRYGDPALQSINTLLFALFVAKFIAFFVTSGGLSADMVTFAGYVGLSVSLNGGISRPTPQPEATPAQISGRLPVRPRFQPAFPK